jgi:hypothetical protein
MKISHLSETNSTPTSGPDQMAGSQAPKMGRSNKFLEEKEEETVEECTTSGSVASVSAPIGGMNRRGKGSMLKGINTSSKYANSAAVKESRDAYQRDYDSSRTGFGRPPREDDEYHNGGDEDIAYTMYLYNTERGRLVQKKIKGYYYDSAKAEGWRPNQIDALKVHGIIRSKFDPNQWVKKEGTRWLKVYPFGKPEDTPDQQMKEATTTQMPFGSITTPDPSPEQQAAYAAQQQQHARFDPRWRLRPEGKEWLLMARQELEAAAQESDHDFKEVGIALSHDQVEKFGKNDKTFAYGNRFHADLTTDILKLMNQISPPQGGYSADDEAIADLSDKYSVASEREKQQLYKMTAKQNNMSTAEAKEYIEDCIAQRTIIDPEQWKEWHRDEEVTENAGTPPSFYTKCKTCGTPYNEHFRFDENGKILSSLVRHPTMKDDFPGMDGMSLKSTSSVPQQSVMPSGTTTQPSLSVDSKGRTQKQWIQAVKAKFPDAQIIQAKMIDGPCVANLSDGRKLSWNKVKQGVAEGLPQTLRKVVPGHAKREIDKKMDAGKFGKTDADKDANFQRYKKIQDKLANKEQGVAEASSPAQQAAIAINMKKNHQKPTTENAEYDDEAGSAESNLHTIARAADGLLDTIDSNENLPEWAQEKIAKVEGMLVAVWDYLESQEEEGIDPQIDEVAAWQKKSGKNKNGGLNAKGVASYRREHPGSKLQTAVTTKPSKLKPGSKAAKRRKSFCARMSGMKGPMKDEHGKPTRKALSLRKWHCESVEQTVQMLESVQRDIVEMKQRLDPKCWKGYKKQGTKMKGDTRVNNCVPVSEAEVSEDKLAQDLYKDFQIFKKGADKGIGSKAKDKDISSKAKDKDIVAKMNEMDGDGAGRDGSNRKSHSTYGSRDKHNVPDGPDIHLGAEHTMKRKDIQDRALDTLTKMLSKPENINVLKRLKNK